MVKQYLISMFAPIKQKLTITTLVVSALLFSITGIISTVQADETNMSPYTTKIFGQEDFVYVWTLGEEGLGDGQDKLVTVDVNPKSDKYGSVIEILSVGGRNEAHHSGFTDDRKYLWAGGLDANKIFIFDVHSNPAKPTLSNVITDLENVKQTYEKVIDPQVNMASSSWDGNELQDKFSIDFNALKLGRAHQMFFGAYSLYSNFSPVKESSYDSLDKNCLVNPSLDSFFKKKSNPVD